MEAESQCMRLAFDLHTHTVAVASTDMGRSHQRRLLGQTEMNDGLWALPDHFILFIIFEKGFCVAQAGLKLNL